MITIFGNVGNAGFALPMVSAYPPDPNQAYQLIWNPALGALDYTLPGSIARWGAIIGTLSDQPDLQLALNGKEPAISAGVAGQWLRYNKSWAQIPYAELSGLPTLGTVSTLNYPGGTTLYLRSDGTWVAPGGAGAGDVVGPAGAVNNNVVFFNGTTGKLLKDSALTLSGSNTGDQTTITGNAGTATTLATARLIDGVAFNGSADIAVVQVVTHAAASKATPVDADEIPLIDSAASNVLKKLTIANLKALMNTLFAALANPVFTGNPTAPTPTVGDNDFSIATTAFVQTGKVPQIQAITTASTVTPVFGNDQVNVLALAANLTINNPTGTAQDAWGLSIRIKDNATARTLTFGSQFRAMGVTLPTTTVISKTLYIGCIYNAADTKWDVTAVAQEA